MATYKIIIDTDLGADVDDALAIYAALKREDVEIVGITTVCGNVKERASAVKKMLKLSNRLDIPVYAGLASGPVKKFDSEKHIMTYEDEFKDLPADNKDGYDGVDFIIDMAKKYKEELYILAIGPATNVAAAILKDKAALSLVKSIHMMGGCCFTNRPEWNIFCDPESASVLVKSGIPLYLVPLECTEKVRLPYWYQKEVTDLAELTGLKGYIGKLAKIWMESRNFAITLHDPLALYSIIHPEFLHFKEQRLEIECEGSCMRGTIMNYSITNLYPATKGNKVFVADYVDGQGMYEHYINNVIRTEDKF